MAGSPAPRRKNDVKVNRGVRVHGTLRPMRKSPRECYLGCEDRGFAVAAAFAAAHHEGKLVCPGLSPGLQLDGAPSRAEGETSRLSQSPVGHPRSARDGARPNIAPGCARGWSLVGSLGDGR